MLVNVGIVILGVLVGVDLIMWDERDWPRGRMTHAALVAFLGAAALWSAVHLADVEQTYGAAILDLKKEVEFLKFKQVAFPKKEEPHK